MVANVNAPSYSCTIAISTEVYSCVFSAASYGRVVISYLQLLCNTFLHSEAITYKTGAIVEGILRKRVEIVETWFDLNILFMKKLHFY